jgi:hypothetical protein
MLHANQGKHWYWLQPDFHSIGDAYEENMEKSQHGELSAAEPTAGEGNRIR